MSLARELAERIMAGCARGAAANDAALLRARTRGAAAEHCRRCYRCNKSTGGGGGGEGAAGGLLYNYTCGKDSIAVATAEAATASKGAAGRAARGRCAAAQQTARASEAPFEPAQPLASLPKSR
ncbi:hypothetical protein JKP88DRAFT_354025 [Tribonema minus]|uniref:Uncharacterized protein n=1 Tax=Tribonema minus TaxID=303371 RepID=A0A836CJN4_9STRA|nr:hypothetical protein JKP88DRAFT_354025 [Tribonema minus]